MAFKILVLTLPALLLSATSWADPIEPHTSDGLRLTEPGFAEPFVQFGAEVVSFESKGIYDCNDCASTTGKVELAEREDSRILSDTIFLQAVPEANNANRVRFLVSLVSEPDDTKKASGAALIETGDWQTVDVTSAFKGKVSADVLAGLKVEAISDVDPVPEPSTLLLLSSGLGWGIARCRRRAT